jgi:AcrR family transcriptional regulator
MSRRRARTREQILDAAEAAFAPAGYRGVRMEELAEAADVSVGSIYGHFGNKDGVYLALVERALDQFAGYLDTAFDPSYTPLEQAMAAGEVYLKFHLQHPGSFRFLAFDGVETRMPELDEGALAVRERVGERLEEILGGFQDRIQQAIEAGEADGGYDSKLVARFLWGAWNGVVSFGLRTDRMALTDDEIAACLRMGRRLVNEGLTAPAHRDPDGYSRGRLLDGGTAAPDGVAV